MLDEQRLHISLALTEFFIEKRLASYTVQFFNLLEVTWRENPTLKGVFAYRKSIPEETYAESLPQLEDTTPINNIDENCTENWNLLDFEAQNDGNLT